MSNELREALAAVSHEVWAHWMKYLFSRCLGQAAGISGPVIPQKEADRWRRQMETAYADLTEKEKDSDREQADKILKVLGAFKSPGEVGKVAEAISKFATEAVKYGYFEGCYRCPAGYFDVYRAGGEESKCPAIKAGHGSESEHCVPALTEWFLNGGEWKEES